MPIKESVQASSYDQARVLSDIVGERNRQDQKWGKVSPDESDAQFNLILGEEVGEVANAILEAQRGGDPANIDKELIQVGAVAVKWLEARKARVTG